MDPLAGRAEGLGKIEAEITGERVAALRRIAETLEGLLGALEDLGRRAAELEGEPRLEALQAHASLRAQARLYRWYLEVQRESLGLFNHRDLDVFYPLPAPLR